MRSFTLQKPISLFSQTLLLGLLLLMISSCGCVRRRMTVQSNPVGALVYVDNQQIGTTPCSVDFTYYGTREIRLVKPGFETLTVNQPIPAPWYEIPPLDLISENLIPQRIQDHRSLSYNMQPQLVVPIPEILARADQLRQTTRASFEAPRFETPNFIAPNTPLLNDPSLNADPFNTPSLNAPPATNPYNNSNLNSPNFGPPNTNPPNLSGPAAAPNALAPAPAVLPPASNPGSVPQNIFNPPAKPRRQPPRRPFNY